MPEVEIKIRFIGSTDKFPSQQLKWLIDIFDLARLRGEKIPRMEITTSDQYGHEYQAKVS